MDLKPVGGLGGLWGHMLQGSVLSLFPVKLVLGAWVMTSGLWWTPSWLPRVPSAESPGVTHLPPIPDLLAVTPSF